MHTIPVCFHNPFPTNSSVGWEANSFLFFKSTPSNHPRRIAADLQTSISSKKQLSSVFAAPPRDILHAPQSLHPMQLTWTDEWPRISLKLYLAMKMEVDSWWDLAIRGLDPEWETQTVKERLLMMLEIHHKMCDTSREGVFKWIMILIFRKVNFQR